MQLSSRLLMRAAIILFALLLTAVTFMVVLQAQQATATNASDLAKVRNYIDAYIQKQYVPDAVNGESGFVIDRTALKTRVDSNGDMNLTTGAGTLGENDDAANAPIIIDNLNQTGVIPGTSVQCTWNTGTGTTNCFDLSKVNAVKARVDAHRAAGFSTDIIDYCLSGHTEAPTTGAWGYIAQTGGLSSDGSIPHVYAFKWGRNGWVGSPHTAYGNTGTLSAASAVYGYTVPSTVPAASACNSTVSDFELMRCQAQWAIYSGSVNGMTGGNIGNGISPTGTNPNLSLAAGQIIDIRTGAGSTIKSYNGAPTVNIPIDTIFNSGLGSINSTLAGGSSGVIVAGRTQMSGGIVAMGLKMLGEPVGTNGFLNSGMPNWNNTLDEKQNTVALSPAYPIPAPGSTIDGHLVVDTTAPTVTNPGTTNITDSSADVYRTANEAATMKVEYGTSPGVYTSTVNNTVLNSSKTVSLTGLDPATRYYYQITSYDGQANGTVTSSDSLGNPLSFETADITSPVLSLPGDIVASTTDPAGAIVSYAAAASDPDDAVSSFGCMPASGSLFPVGTTVVNCSATDSHGNSSAGSFNVTVSLSDIVPPTISSITPTGMINTNNADVAMYYSDASGVNPATAILTWDGSPLGGCTATADYISCPQTILPQGAHTIAGSVADINGNVANGSASVFIDSLAPRVSSIKPSGNTNSSSAAITAYLADGALRASWPLSADSGIDDSTLAVALDGSPVAGCAITDLDPTLTVDAYRGFVQCPAVTGLAEGSHTTTISINDNAGNSRTSSRSFVVDTLAPSVSASADATSISGSYSDTGTGINAASVAVDVDGNPVAGCTATTTAVSCATPAGLAPGTHTATVAVKDNVGNLGTASASFTITPPCTAGKPNLTLTLIHAYWGSYTDYTLGKLSVDYSLSNVGVNNAVGAAITGGSATNGVIPMVPPAISVGDIAAGSSTGFMVQYTVPAGIAGFRASLEASAADDCGTVYTYP